MEKKLALAMALAFLTGGLGLATVPTSLAVSPDCNHDYVIDDTEDTRQLPGDASEVGLSEVEAPSDEELTVTLESLDDEMEIGIFEVVDGDCVRSTNVSDNCDQDVVLNTSDGEKDSVDCTLEAPLSGTRDFFLVAENQQGDELEYSVVSKVI